MQPSPPADVRSAAPEVQAASGVEEGPEQSAVQHMNAPQPLPLFAVGPAVWDLVRADITERDAMGAKKYGRRLTPFNGRDPLIDAYQGALDLVVYLRQVIYERDGA